MSTGSFRRAALAAYVVLACGTLAAPAAGAPTGALTATLVPADGQPVHGMIHMYPNGTNHPSRAGLRALLTGLPPGAPVSFRSYSGNAQEFDHLLSTTADADGNVIVGMERPRWVNDLDLEFPARLAVFYDSPDTATHEVSAPTQPVRPVQPGERPEVLLAGLHGTSGDGMHYAVMLHYDNGDPGPGVVSYIASVSDCEPALYRLSIVGQTSLRNFMDYTADGCMHWTSGRELLVDDTTWDLVARNNTDLVLSRVVAGADIPLASSQSVKVGKLLGVNY